MSQTMQAPLTNTQYAALSGTTYTSDASNLIQNVAAEDVTSLLDMGCTLLPASKISSANGLFSFNMPLTAMKNADGTTLAAAAAAGKFGISSTIGTSLLAVGEGAQNNTKTDDMLAELVLPQNYVAGQNVNITVNSALIGTGTAGTKTLAVKAYKTAIDGTQGANIGPAAQNLVATSATDLVFAITGTTLNPGDHLVLELETVVQETANVSTLTAHVNSVRVG